MVTFFKMLSPVAKLSRRSKYATPFAGEKSKPLSTEKGKVLSAPIACAKIHPRLAARIPMPCLNFSTPNNFFSSFMLSKTSALTVGD